MTQATVAVFVWTKENDLCLFASLEDASGWMEAIDVDDGEYPVIHTVEGAIVRAATPDGRDGPVVLTVTDDYDLVGLVRRVRAYHPSIAGLLSAPEDPAAFADEMLGREHEQRRSRRPRWLARYRDDGRD